MRQLLYFIIFSEAFLISYILIPIIIRLALRWRVVDNPGQRKVHASPKPLMGGVGIFLGFMLVILGNLIAFYALRNTEWMQTNLQSLTRISPHVVSALPRLAVLLAGGLFIHLLGLVDDVYKEKLTYKPKFIVQIVIILLVAISGIRTQFMPGNTLDVIITTIWIVGVTNSFNLLDNLDGLTAGVSIIAALILFAVAILQGQILFAFMLIALAGACLGFLFYNFNPSKLFMGDSGSLFLGYMFGALTVTGSYVVKSSESILPVAMPVLILSIPLYDTFSVMFIRWREGRPLFVGDKRHFSHRLLELGMSHRGAVVFIYLVSFCVGIVAILLPYISVAGSILILVQAASIYTLITILISVGRRNQNNS